VPLPSEPSLEHLRGQAKTLQRRVRAGEAEALALVARRHPRPPGDTAAFTRADAQLVVARGYGFASWPKLRAHLGMVERFGRSPHRAGEAADPVDEFLRLATLTYGADDPARPAAARALHAAHPEIARASLHAAAAVGDPAAVGALLAADPGAVRRQGGPHRWEPLLYLTYSRVGGDEALAAARLLLGAGADPNAGFMWDGLVPPFTALTGALGRGEGDPPPHRDALALARLLLEAGADANDGQVIYNHSWTPGDAWLALLLEFGLGRGDGGPWRARLGEQVASPRQNLEDVLTWSAEYAMPSRIRMALAAGVDPDGRGTRHPGLRGRTALELALRNGDEESAAMLRAAGAREPELDAAEANDAAYMRGDAAAVEGPPSPGLVIRAAEHGRRDVVRLLAEHGADVSHRQRRTALHEAALRGDLELVRLLIELGADPTIRDTDYDATPEGWAEHAGEQETVAFLRSLSP
jgi:ankyrin repeat protein